MASHEMTPELKRWLESRGLTDVTSETQMPELVRLANWKQANEDLKRQMTDPNAVRADQQPLRFPAIPQNLESEMKFLGLQSEFVELSNQHKLLAIYGGFGYQELGRLLARIHERLNLKAEQRQRAEESDQAIRAMLQDYHRRLLNNRSQHENQA